ncbi:MAG: hypothetical protein IJX53_08980 [Clostridia bacterium]|nr:hypothetical protein [Clostridia bacterium]
MKKSTAWRRPLLLCAIIAFGMHALRAFVLCPLNVQVNTNVIYASTALPAVLDILVDLTLMAVIYISYAFILETVFREGFRRALPLALLYLGATAFGAAANLVMDLTVGGAAEEIFDYLLISTVWGAFMEFAQLALVLLCACLLAHGYTGPLAPTGLFSRRNRLQLSALVAAGITVLFRVGARLIYDIDLGLPTTSVEIVDMVAGYGSDLLIPFLGYLGMVLLMMRHPDHTEPAQIEET